jgi:hypothetical protein
MTLTRLNKNYDGFKKSSLKGDTSHYPGGDAAYILKAKGSIDVLPSINRKMPKKKIKKSAQALA